MRKASVKYLVLNSGIVITLGIGGISSALAVDTYTCPQSITCDLTTLSKPSCTTLPSDWTAGNYQYTGGLQITDPQNTKLTFTSAQSYPNSGAVCNFLYGDSSAYYIIGIYNTNYFAALGVVSQWQPTKDGTGKYYDYCYSKYNNSFQTNDPMQCPVQYLTANQSSQLLTH